MRKKNGIIFATTSLMMLSGGAVWADQAAPAKPAIPSLADIFTSSGITATGYVDATFSGFGYSGDHISEGSVVPHAGGSDTFTFQQAGLTLAYQPSSGFGAVLNPVATPYSSVYVNNYAPDSNYYLNSGSTPHDPYFTIFQGFVQYVSGPWTVIAGKYATLAGAEVYAPTGNTNVTRSILFSEEPLTHTGVRATYAPDPKYTFVVGVNNGWFNSGDPNSLSAAKTLELGATFVPSKVVTIGLTNYYGRDYNYFETLTGLEMFDTVVTWTATSQLTVLGSFDYGNVQSRGSQSPSADWWGVAGYLNYQFNPLWRVSLRAEYFDDEKGYLTDQFALTDGPPLGTPGKEALKEVTLTFGWDPSPHFEFRIEGRYDDPDSVKSSSGGPSVDVYSKTEQGWLEALYKF